MLISNAKSFRPTLILMGSAASINMLTPATQCTNFKDVARIPGLFDCILVFLPVGQIVKSRSVCSFFLERVPRALQMVLPTLFSRVNDLSTLIQNVIPLHTLHKKVYPADDEELPGNNTNIYSWIELAFFISGRQCSGSISISMQNDSVSNFSIPSARFLQSKDAGSFELTTTQRTSVCIKSSTFYDFLAMVYLQNRQLCIHGFAVGIGSNDAYYLTSLGGLFDLTKRAYVLVLRSDNSLYVQVLQVQSNDVNVELVCLLQASLFVEAAVSEPTVSQVAEPHVAEPAVSASSSLLLKWQRLSHMELLLSKPYGKVLQLVHPNSHHLALSVYKCIGIDGPITCRVFSYSCFPRTVPLPNVIIDTTFGLVPEFTSPDPIAIEYVISENKLVRDVMCPFTEGISYMPENLYQDNLMLHQRMLLRLLGGLIFTDDFA